MGLPQSETRDMPLPPGEYMHVQDTTKGPVKVYNGPMVINQTGQEQPVAFDYAARVFEPVSLFDARRKCVFVAEDHYCTLYNPAFGADDSLIFPPEGQCSNPTSLQHGERVNIPGPAQFALWPGQSAKVIEGHRLRSNQYLLVEIVNGQKAAENWQRATVETAEGDDSAGAVAKKMAFRTGEMIIIKGTEAGFFIPSTGVRVVPDNQGNYVRNAMTLEQLEFCILVDENGEKRYERGPQVVFPEPTEVFWADAQGARKFRAYELSKISGLYVKVIDDYVDEDGVTHAAGEELFITGDKTPIYYPRPEHAIVKYGDSEMHYATAIPKGEGRYVLDRLTGQIKTEHGEQMLLPDPRTHVIVRRVLTPKECALWFPGNETVLQHNIMLRKEAAESRSGYAEGEQPTSGARVMLESQPEFGATGSSPYTRSGRPAMADQLSRSTSYTPPRTITLDTKFDGAVCIQVWTGFAVMVVGKDGHRQPIIGPSTVLLDYDQTLEVLRLSTGKPKNTDHLHQTVYLNVANNKVSDIVDLVTKDQVNVQIKLSLHVNFEGDPANWFNVENYVKLLCDRVRSMLKGTVRQYKIEDFFENHVQVVRDALLGVRGEGDTERPGMRFDANGMHVVDVDVLGFAIPDTKIEHELLHAQHDALATSLLLQNKERAAEAQMVRERLTRNLRLAAAETDSLDRKLAGEAEAQRAQLRKAAVTHERECAEARLAAAAAAQDVTELEHENKLRREREIAELEQAKRRAEHDLELAALQAHDSSVVARLEAASSKLVAGLEGAQRVAALELLNKHGLRLSAITGSPISEALRNGLGSAGADWVIGMAEQFIGNEEPAEDAST